jgi:putative nucleotidyltransferase with HDIG domain
LEPYELFEDINTHLINDEKPSIYLTELYETKELTKYPFNMINNLFDTPQQKDHHPEGSVWNHVLLVVDEGAKRKKVSKDIRVFMWATLLHDIGKVPTTKMRKGRITSYDHDKIGAEMSRKFLEFFNCEEEFIDKVSALVRWHMQILFVVKDLPYANIEKMMNEVDLEEIGLISLCDRFGRGNMTGEKLAKEKRNVQIFIDKCISYKRKRI